MCYNESKDTICMGGKDKNIEGYYYITFYDVAKNKSG